ncbi:MAG: GNAT family N-acetyltransferase [Faecousia sp.]
MGLTIRKSALIQTERLTLRPYSEQDLEQLTALLTNREITKTFMVPDFVTREQAMKLAKKLISFSRLEDTMHLEYGIYLNHRLIGFVNDCGMEDREIEIGYVIHPDHQGHGYGTEAVKAVIEELREMGFQKVKAGFFMENTASRRVMEKCGMKQIDFYDEQEYQGALHKCLYYEICFSANSELQSC